MFFFNDIIFVKFLLLVVPVLASVAFVTLLERKILSLAGLRLGPTKVSFFGILQPVADALKLAGKQANFLSNYSYFFYYASSFVLLVMTLLVWSSLHVGSSLISFKFSLILLFMALSFNSFSSILAGWSTFSKYSLVGSIRTVSQMISYESALYFCLFSIILLFFSFSLQSMFFTPLFLTFFFLIPFFYVWVPSFLAELNRTPYDFSEGESELVSGFNTEFGSVGFTLIFLTEYSNIIFFSIFTSILFFLGHTPLFFFLCVIFVIWIRSVLPRFRFDKLMSLAWKFFIPFLTFCFICLVLSL